MHDIIQVRLGKLGARTEEFTLNGNATVKDLVTASGVETAGYQFRVNSEVADLNTELSDGDIVVLLAAVKGGSH